MGNLKVGLQLYSVREEMEKDMDATLSKVKAMGYDYVEFAGYFGKTAEEVKALLEKHGLECISVHQGYEIFIDDKKNSVEYLKGIGAKYCAVPWMDKEKHKGNEIFSKTVKEFKEVSAALKQGGIQLLYHNHEFEFEKFEDKFLLDWLYESLNEEELQTEIDTCWVCYAGQNPAEYIRKYSGRSPIVHLKDFTCTEFANGPAYALIDKDGKDSVKQGREEVNFMFKPLGKGLQDFPAILKACVDAGAEFVIVEQDSHPEGSPLEDVAISREYLKGLGI